MLGGQGREGVMMTPAAKFGFGLVALIFIILFLETIVFRTPESPHVAPAPGPLVHQSNPASQNAGTLAGNASNYRLLALPEDQQAAFLGMAVQEGCIGRRAFYMGSYTKDNRAFWSVGCSNGKEYEVTILSDAIGTTTVTDCSFLRIVGHMNCFEKVN
jgi:hypothetical protein